MNARTPRSSSFESRTTRRKPAGMHAGRYAGTVIVVHEESTMFIRRRRKPARGAPRRGQSVVELALMMPLLALIMIGTLDLARAYFYYTRLTDSVIEGALIGVHTPQIVTDTSGDPDSPTTYSTNNESVKYRV